MLLWLLPGTPMARACRWEGNGAPGRAKGGRGPPGWPALGTAAQWDRRRKVLVRPWRVPACQQLSSLFSSFFAASSSPWSASTTSTRSPPPSTSPQRPSPLLPRLSAKAGRGIDVPPPLPRGSPLPARLGRGSQPPNKSHFFVASCPQLPPVWFLRRLSARFPRTAVRRHG